MTRATATAIKIMVRLLGILRPLPEMAFLSLTGAGGVSGVMGVAVSSEGVAEVVGVMGVEGASVGTGSGVGAGAEGLLETAPKPLIAEDGLVSGGLGVVDGAGGVGTAGAAGAAGVAGAAGAAGAPGVTADGVPHLGQKVAPSAIMALHFKHCFIFLLSLTPYKRQPTQRVRTKLRINTIYYNINGIKLMLYFLQHIQQ